MSGGAPEPDAAAGLAERRFARALATAATVGLAIRLVYAIGYRFDAGLKYDAPVYIARARFLIEGRGFIDPDAWYFRDISTPGAIQPPGNTLFIAAGQYLGLESSRSLMVWGCVLGTATIVVLGLAGRALLDRRTGVWAASIAAVHPGLWSYDATVMAETLAQFLVALLFLLVYRFWRDPSPSRAAWLGAVAAAAALTRSELIVLVPALVVPVCLASRGTTRAALTRVGAAGLWCTLVLAPWVGWNAARFEHPATLATGLDLSLSYSHCDETWYGPETGLWNVFCGSDLRGDPQLELLDETEIGELYRQRAGAYVRDNLHRWPTVVAARVGRTVGFYAPSTHLQQESDREIREVPVLWSALVGSWLLAALGAVALVRPAPRSRAALAVLLAPLVAGLAGAAITFGTTRYRAAGEVGLVLLGAYGIGVVQRMLARRRAQAARRSADGWDELGPASPEVATSTPTISASALPRAIPEQP